MTCKLSGPRIAGFDNAHMLLCSSDSSNNAVVDTSSCCAAIMLTYSVNGSTVRKDVGDNMLPLENSCSLTIPKETRVVEGLPCCRVPSCHNTSKVVWVLAKLHLHMSHDFWVLCPSMALKDNLP